MNYKSVESMLIFVDRPLCSFIRCNLSCSGSDRDKLQIGHLKFSKIVFTNPEYRIVFALIIDLKNFCFYYHQIVSSRIQRGFAHRKTTALKKFS